MKPKYMNITPKMLEGKYDVTFNLKGTVRFEQHWLEFKGQKYYCSKIGNEEWHIQKIDDFPFYKLPKDFFEIIK